MLKAPSAKNRPEHVWQSKGNEEGLGDWPCAQEGCNQNVTDEPENAACHGPSANGRETAEQPDGRNRHAV